MTPSSRGPRHLRSQVITRARWRCEYCRAPQAGSAYTFHLDHVLPRAKGGIAVLENLALACALCNGVKREKVTATDPRTGDVECLKECVAEADERVSLEEVRAALTKIPGSLTTDFIAERDERF
jgi:HNH endonuclease